MINLFIFSELIKRYNDKLKECDRLKQEVDTLNKQTKEVTCNYNSSLAKIIKLELVSRKIYIYIFIKCFFSE